MLKYCLSKWEQNKKLLEEKLKTDSSLNGCDYTYLVKLVVDYILNDGQPIWELGCETKWDSERITVIDNGDYQGTQLFLIPCKTYQPCEYEYLMTYVGYGSCSGCDTLKAIQDWGDKLLTEKQVKDFMTLCKDILTNTIKPYNGGWRFEKDFEEVECKEE
jgi:hypothetical protein